MGINGLLILAGVITGQLFKSRCTPWCKFYLSLPAIRSVLLTEV